MRGYLVAGTNYGDRRANLLAAISYVGSICNITGQSEIYESPDFLGSGSPYCNVVLEIETPKCETELEVMFKDYEFRAGRTSQRRERGEVPVDIDIVIWDDRIRRPLDFNSAYFRKGFSQICNSDIVKISK